MTSDAGRNLSFWRRLLAEFVVIVVGVLVALGVDAARDRREERVRADAYLRQLRADLMVTSEALIDGIEVEERARGGADRAVQAINSSSLPPPDSLRKWVVAATNSSAAFHPTMGTITALVESGELRLIHDEELRRKVLQYHGSVETAMRIVDAVNPHMWRALERLGSMLSWPALLDANQQQRFPIDWDALASDRAFHGAVYDMRLAAHNRLFALHNLRTHLDSLVAEMDANSNR